MADLDLGAFAARSRALIDATPPRTRRETRTWLVEPFLEVLGWQVRGETCVTDRTLEETRLEYVLSVDSVPTLLVAVEPWSESLRDARESVLLETMAWTGVDRAIYTNGRDYLILAGTTTVDRLTCRLESLPDHESVLRHYSRETAHQRFDADQPSRAAVARRLAIDRPAVVDSIVERLTDVTGTRRYGDEFGSAAGRFLDRLVVSFTTDRWDHDQDQAMTRDGVSLEYTESPIGDRIDLLDDEQPTEPHSESDESDSGDRVEPASADAEPVDGDGTASDTDDEYVVRFFDGRGSVGAIGHSSAAQVLIHAAEYCLERGLGDAIVPWSPSSGGAETVLNDRPVRADGPPMAAPEQLSNGWYLETDGDVDEQAMRVKALASRVGLRVMLTGDWGS